MILWESFDLRLASKLSVKSKESLIINIFGLSKYVIIFFNATFFFITIPLMYAVSS